jgi:hypothetical protein
MDMDEMIKACEETRREDETIVFAIGAGRIAPKLGMKKAQLAAMQYINDLEGFIGIHPVSLWRTLLLFDTLNHAKAGLNQMKAKGIGVGQIAPILIPTIHVKGETANEE